MAMAWIWTGMVVLSVGYGIYAGTIDAVGAAAMEGAAAAVELCLSMAGIMCLWNGVMSVMRSCGLTESLSRLFRPVLGRLLPNACRGMRRPFPPSPAMYPPTFWDWATRPPRWGSKPPSGWLWAVEARPATSCVCWWYSTPPPFSSYPPLWPASALPWEQKTPLTSCRRCGWRR